MLGEVAGGEEASILEFAIEKSMLLEQEVADHPQDDEGHKTVNAGREAEGQRASQVPPRPHRSRTPATALSMARIPSYKASLPAMKRSTPSCCRIFRAPGS